MKGQTVAIKQLVVVAIGAVVMASAAALPARGQDGELDGSFGVGGKVLSSCSGPCVALAVTPEPGGGMFVAGRITFANTWTVTKLSAAGAISLDWVVGFDPFDFAQEGAADTGSVLALRVDSSSEVLVAGWAEVNGNEIPAVARLLPTGELNEDFNLNGLRMAAVPVDWTGVEVNAARILPSGGSVFGGRCSDCVSFGLNSGFLVKLLPSGDPDPSFSGDGWFTFNSPWLGHPSVKDLVVAENGVITAVIEGSTFGGGPGSEVLRVTAAGNLDVSFGGGDGMSDHLYDPPNVAQAVAVDPNTGAIVVAMAEGASTLGGGALVGLQAAGTADPNFGVAGWLNLDIEEGSRIDAVAFQTDGKVVAAGTINANGSQTGGFLLARVAGGALDPTYDGNGLKRVEFDLAADARDSANALTLVGGRLVVVGSASNSLDLDFAVVRTDNASIFADGFERGSVGAWGE